MTRTDGDELDDDELRAADGRVPGRRGLATRQKLLEHTEQMLEASTYRDIKVIDIAREAGTSPATFYQYFPDVEAAILVLAQEATQDGKQLAEIVTKGPWTGPGRLRDRRTARCGGSSTSGASTRR